MAKKPARMTFEQSLELLRKNGFTLAASTAAPSGQLVSKGGVAAILVPSNDEFKGPASFFERPGILVRGELARLLDRGYQKFIKTHQYELPATANQLHAIHAFSEEVTKLIGGESLYNQSLGTTSDLYEYDRLRGREEETAVPKRPWELASGH